MLAERVLDHWIALLAEPQWRAEPFHALAESLVKAGGLTAVRLYTVEVERGSSVRDWLARAGDEVESRSRSVSYLGLGTWTERTTFEKPADDEEFEDLEPQRVFTLRLGSATSLAGLRGLAKSDRFRAIAGPLIAGPYARGRRTGYAGWNTIPPRQTVAAGTRASELILDQALHNVREWADMVFPESGISGRLRLYVPDWEHFTCHARIGQVPGIEELAAAAARLTWKTLNEAPSEDWPAEPWAKEITRNGEMPVPASRLWQHFVSRSADLAGILHTGSGADLAKLVAAAPAEARTRAAAAQLHQHIGPPLLRGRFPLETLGLPKTNPAPPNFADRFATVVESMACDLREDADADAVLGGRMYPLIHVGRLTGFLYLDTRGMNPTEVVEFDCRYRPHAPACAAALENAASLTSNRVLSGLVREDDRARAGAAQKLLGKCLHRFEPLFWVHAVVKGRQTFEKLVRMGLVNRDRAVVFQNIGNEESNDEGLGLRWRPPEIGPEAVARSEAYRAEMLADELALLPDAVLSQMAGARLFLNQVDLPLDPAAGDLMRVRWVGPYAVGHDLGNVAGLVAQIETALRTRLDERTNSLAKREEAIALSLETTKTPVMSMAADRVRFSRLNENVIDELAEPLGRPIQAETQNWLNSRPEGDLPKIIKLLASQFGAGEAFAALKRAQDTASILGSYADLIRQRTARVDDTTPAALDQVVSRACMCASLAFYNTLPVEDIEHFKQGVPAGRMHRFVLNWERPWSLGIDRMDRVLPFPLFQEAAPSKIQDVVDLHKVLAIDRRNTAAVKQPRLLWMALEELFLLAMRRHRRKAPFEINFDAVVEEGATQFRLSYACDDATVEEEQVRELDTFRAVRQLVAGLPGDPTLLPAGHEGYLTFEAFHKRGLRDGELSNVLTFECRENHGGCLTHHHDAAAQAAWAARWENLKTKFRASVSGWDPSVMTWGPRGHSLSDTMPKLIKDHYLDQDIFKAYNLWKTSDGTSPGPGFWTMAEMEGIKRIDAGSTSYGQWTDDLRIYMPKFTNGPSFAKSYPGVYERKGLYASLPELYEIILSKECRAWDLKSNSLVMNSYDAFDALKKKLRDTKRKGLEFRLDWDPGGEWNRELNGSESHTWRLFVADNGYGVSPDRAEDFLLNLRRDPKDQGALMRHVVPRSKLWCTELWMYWTLGHVQEADGAKPPVQGIDLYRVTTSEPIPAAVRVQNMPVKPVDIQTHFANGGACFEFIFQVYPERKWWEY